MGPGPPAGRGLAGGRGLLLPLLRLPGHPPSSGSLQDEGRDTSGGRYTQIRVPSVRLFALFNFGGKKVIKNPSPVVFGTNTLYFAK